MLTKRFQIVAFLLIIIASLLVSCSSNSGGPKPQSGATFSGNLAIEKAGENGTASGGEITFTTTADGSAIESMSYSLTGDACTADGVTIQGVGYTTERTPPPEVKNGGFEWEENDFLVKGTFTSPTEAIGTITITIQHSVQTSINSPATTQVTCDYGTWAWNSSSE